MSCFLVFEMVFVGGVIQGVNLAIDVLIVGFALPIPVVLYEVAIEFSHSYQVISTA